MTGQVTMFEYLYGVGFMNDSSLADSIKGNINDGKLTINKQTWADLNDHYSQTEITEAIKEEIISGRIKLPLKELTLEDAENSFLKLKDYQCNPIQSGRIKTRYEYEFGGIENGLFIDESNVGNVASDYFQQANRFKCGSINAPSPVRTWENEKFLNGLLKALWTLKCKEVNPNTFRTCLALRKYVASQFKPTIAKSIYEKFNSRVVLDFSAGWGDRLCGFYSCENTERYIGIDPNTDVCRTYPIQAEFYSRYSNRKDVDFICSPAEDVEFIGEGTVDTVFTSPPYFNIERYSDESTQSYKRYRKVDEWLQGFLFKAINMSVRALAKGGHLIINISDVYSGHKVNKICDPMNRHIESLGMEYCGMIGMRMAKRPNSNAASNGVFVEPIWVWRKP